MATINGNDTDETLNGTGNPDTINGLGGDDVIKAGRKSDEVSGGAGDDVIYGKGPAGSVADEANPTVEDMIASTTGGQADGGSNTLNGDDGDDIIIGRKGADTIHGDNDQTGTIEFASKNSVTYTDVPDALQGFQVTGFGPEGASDAVGGENNEGIGVGNKTVDYLYRQSSQATGDEGSSGDLGDYEGGEALTFEIGTTAKEGSISVRNLDTGENVKITGYLDGKKVGSFKFEGTGDPNSNDIYDIPVEFDGKLFDEVTIEALPGDGPTLDKSTSFNVKGADFTTVAAGDDTIVGGGGNDNMKGGYGNDLFIEGGGGGSGGTGNDTIDGGAGSDTVDYSLHPTKGPGNLPGLIVNLSDQDVTVGTNPGTDKITVDGKFINDDQPGGQEVSSSNTVAAGTAEVQFNDQVDTLISIENVIGTDRQDVMIGSDADNTFKGGDRADFIDGRDGNDRLFGEDGDDKMFGGDGNDRLIGGAGNDDMRGGDGNDRLKGGEGNDVLSGGAGSDTADFSDAKGDVDLDLRPGQAGPNGYAAAEIDRDGDGSVDEIDRVLVSNDDSGIENVKGGRGNDNIRGNDLDNTLNGGKGNDFLRGGDGNDTLIGGKGNDTIVGGDDIDTYKVGGGVKPDGGLELDLSAPGPNGYAAARIDRDGDGNAEEVDRIEAASMENVHGTRGDDKITGNALDNTIKSGKGDDVLDGGEGADKLFAGKGNDLLVFDAADFTGAATKNKKYKKDADFDGFDKKNDGDIKISEEIINEKIYQGGQGYDVLKVDGDAEINMLGKGISGIEAVVGGAGDQVVKADLNEVQREGDDAGDKRDKGFDTFTFISGDDAGDKLELFGNGWSLAGSKLGSNMGNANATPTNKEDFLSQDEMDALGKAMTGTASLKNGIPAVDGDKLNVFVFEKGNGTFVTVWTDLTLDDISLNGVNLDSGAIA